MEIIIRIINNQRLQDAIPYNIIIISLMFLSSIYERSSHHRVVLGQLHIAQLSTSWLCTTVV